MMVMKCKFVEHLCAYDCRNPRGIDTLVRCWSETLTSIVIEQSGFNMAKFDELKVPHMRSGWGLQPVAGQELNVLRQWSERSPDG
jgi:hypothetical protein